MMYRNGIFPHEVRRALEGRIEEIESAAKQSGRRVSDPEIRPLLQPLYEKLDGSPRSRHRRDVDR
jgi:hypothetical protein